MSKEFIESGINSKLIRKAATQERQLAYFTRSEMQDDYLTTEYLTAWAERKYQTSDYFLNFVKSVFKTENFLSFFKYLRKPLPSAKIINNKIAPQLRRVFNAENSEFKYVIDGIDEIDYVKMLNIKEFENELFGRMLFSHNSIIVCDVDDDPYRYFVDIKDVVSIEKSKYGIGKIAFKGSIDVNDETINGYVLIDDKKYAFFDKDFNEIQSVSHSLGHCPAHFISPKVSGDNWVVRESIFTYIREELEEYTFLKTLQKMTEPNGAIPIVTQLDVDIINDDEDISGDEKEPPSDSIMGSQRSQMFSDTPPKGESILQAGSIFKVPVIEKDGGGLDMDAVKNFINFHYIPVNSLEYLNNRIKETENSIVYTIVGGMIDGVKEGSKNELQVEESLSVLQNTLVYFADSFNYIRQRSDKDMLLLKYGVNVIEVSIFYGTDFFLDTESMLYTNLERAQNAIERKNILIRINQNRYRGNQNKLSRQEILYGLIPYISDNEFKIAVDAEMVDENIFKYQTRFNYWISQFESQYGDIVTFYKELDVEKPQKLALINNLILNIIN